MGNTPILFKILDTGNRKIETRRKSTNLFYTAGCEEHSPMLDTHIDYGSAFAIVFSVNDQKSFTAVRTLYIRILAAKDKTSILEFCLVISYLLYCCRHRLHRCGYYWVSLWCPFTQN